MIRCATGQAPDDSLPLTAEVFSFFQLFSKCLGVDCVSLDDLQCICSGGDVSAQSVAQEVYFQLLNPPCAEKWKEAAVKFGAAWSVVHPQVHYDELSYRERALILKRLCEHQLDRNEEIRTEVKRLGPAAFRMNCSVGLDMQGNSYWMLEDHTSQAILFAEKPHGGAPSQSTHCVMVARNLDEIAAVLKELQVQVEQTLHDKPSLTTSIGNNHFISAKRNLTCVICAKRIRKGAEVHSCCQCCCCSHADCVHVPEHPAGKWFCPACSPYQQKLLISSIQERLERLVPAHQKYLKLKEKTEKELKRLSFFYGRDRCQSIDLRQSRLRTRRDINYSELAASMVSHAEKDYQVVGGSSSSEEQSVESGEEDEELLSRRGQRYQRLLEKRSMTRSFANCMDEKRIHSQAKVRRPICPFWEEL